MIIKNTFEIQNTAGSVPIDSPLYKRKADALPRLCVDTLHYETLHNSL